MAYHFQFRFDMNSPMQAKICSAELICNNFKFGNKGETMKKALLIIDLQNDY